MINNDPNTFKQIVEHYGLRPVALVGRPGTGKTTAAKKLSNMLNVKSYLLDKPLFVHIVKKYKVENDDIFNFYVNQICKDKDTYIECLEEFRETMIKLLCDELEKEFNAKPRYTNNKSESIATQGFVYEPKKTILLDGISPGKEILQSSQIYHFQADENMALRKALAREGFSEHDPIMRPALLVVNEATDTTLRQDLIGLEDQYQAVTNHHTNRSMDNITTMIIHDLNRNQ
ncbi:MAG: AAA family ATPase [Firmicutes bacterium]|nr:AAA family ATPase [Bacillota bacterium]